jgi:translation initiation factor IF-2
MSKKRVHELAKEAGLENREAVAALRAAGLSVKTHSSSVYEEEAMAILTKAKGPQPEAPRRRAGMMIVKKRSAYADSTDGTGSEGAGEAAALAPEPAAPAPQHLTSPTHRPSSAHVYRRPVEPEPEAAEPTYEAAPVAEPQAVSEPAPDAPADLPAEPAAAAAPQAAAPGQPATAASASSSPADPAAPSGESAPAVPPMLQPIQEVVPQTREEQRAVAQAKPSRPMPPPAGPGGATVVRMIDRDKLMERVPGRRLGGGGGQPARPAGGAGAGGQRFGQVTELKVVTDPFGRGREMVPLGQRDKKKGPLAPGPANSRLAVNRRGRIGGKRDMNTMRERSLYPSRLKKKKSGKRLSDKQQATQPKASKRVIRMKENIVVADLAHQLGIKSTDIIRRLMALGSMVTQNQSIDFDTTQLIAQEFSYTVESVAFAEGEHIETPQDAEEAANLVSRSPVVTVMGHVDHGKTSLLDAIRKTRVASGEAGGITQHIGAYQVPVGKKGSVTFLDTPGHAAFTSMRARGAQVTDIVVLVVAADDGVMPQTEEAIKHAQAAKVPIIVAVNKMDRPDANAERVTQELAKFSLVPEAWGGETLFINTSATKGTGVPELLEAILLQAEVLELQANPQRAAVGVVVEAQLDRGRGPVATVLIRQGTLRRGDAMVVGSCSGKLRAMVDDQGRQVKSAGPSSAVEITGLDAVPEAGDTLHAAETTEAARRVAEHRMSQKKGAESTSTAAVSLDDLMKRMQGASVLELRVVLKADVQGSVEAVRGALEKLSTDEVKVNVIYGGVGGITESDIMLAAASRGLVLGFGVRPDSKARAVAEREVVEVRTYKIIYEAVDDVIRAMEGLLQPEARDKIIGRAEVRELFRVSKVGVIGGCRVVEGKAQRAGRVRVLRDSVQVYDGKVSSLRSFKNDAREVEAGADCGVGVESFNDVKVGDVMEFYLVEEVARTLGGTAAARDAKPNKRPGSSGAGAAAHF